MTTDFNRDIANQEDRRLRRRLKKITTKIKEEDEVNDYESVVSISFDEFKSAVASNGFPNPNLSQFNSFMAKMSIGKITSKQEAAMALAQFIHESQGLTKKREIKCANTNCPNEYRNPKCDAPNQYYYGRGYIQLTGCDNYKRASKDLYGDDRLVNNADQVASNEDIAWATAFWYWRNRVHDKGGSTGQFGLTTQGINPGECKNSQFWDRAKKRYQIYVKVRSAFGLPGKGDPSGCYPL